MDKKNVYSNFFWRFMERCGAQTVTFVVSVMLARMLGTDIYGQVALIIVITSILQVFLDGGFSTALIQKKDADDLDFSSVFYFNIIFGVVLYLILFIVAPFIAYFFKMRHLTPVIRVLGLTLIVTPLKSVQQAYVSRHQMFKKFFGATLGGTIGAAFIGVFMAYKGFGVWALVLQNIFNMTVDTIILWIVVKWRPIKKFSFSRLKSLLRFGWKMLISELLDAVYINLRQLIIGRVYTTSDLAFYNKGNQFPNIIATNINASIDSVLFPAMANQQENKEVVRNMTRRAIKISTYLIMPMMTGLAVCAGPLVRLVLTDKWMSCVPYLRIFCVSYSFYTIHTANLNAIKALGRSDMFLKLEIIKKSVGLIVLACTLWRGPLVMAYSMLLIGVLSQVINSWPNRTLLGYRYLDQVKDMLPQIGISCLMGLLVYCVSFFKLGDFATIMIQIPLGIVIYIAESKVFHIDSFEYCIAIMKQYIPNKRK